MAPLLSLFLPHLLFLSQYFSFQFPPFAAILYFQSLCFGICLSGFVSLSLEIWSGHPDKISCAHTEKETTSIQRQMKVTVKEWQTEEERYKGRKEKEYGGMEERNKIREKGKSKSIQPIQVESWLLLKPIIDHPLFLQNPMEIQLLCWFFSNIHCKCLW